MIAGQNDVDSNHAVSASYDSSVMRDELITSFNTFHVMQCYFSLIRRNNNKANTAISPEITTIFPTLAFSINNESLYLTL